MEKSDFLGSGPAKVGSVLGWGWSRGGGEIGSQRQRALRAAEALERVWPDLVQNSQNMLKIMVLELFLGSKVAQKPCFGGVLDHFRAKCQVRLPLLFSKK